MRFLSLILALLLTQTAGSKWCMSLPRMTSSSRGWVITNFWKTGATTEKPKVYCTHLDTSPEKIVWYYSNGGQITETWAEYYERRGIICPVRLNCQSGRCCRPARRRWLN